MLAWCMPVRFVFEIEWLCYTRHVQYRSNRSNNLHQRTEEILSKYCKLNAATIEACINHTGVLAGGTRVGTYRIFRNICTSCFTVYSPYFTTCFARLRVSHRANERVLKYTSLLSLLSFALRCTRSILALCISCLFQILAANTANYLQFHKRAKRHQGSSVNNRYSTVKTYLQRKSDSFNVSLM